MGDEDREYILILDKISKSLGQRKILDNVSMKVKKGEICAILGPNGAGKTTIFRIISGILTPDSGNIYINEINIQKNKDVIYTCVGYLPENVYLYEDFKVEEIARYFAQLHGTRYNPEILKTTGLIERKNQYISQLSFGLKRRVALTITLIHNPELIILDEYTNGLDFKTSLSIKKLLLRLKKNYHSILFSTHNLYEAEEISDHIYIINNGKIVAEAFKDNKEKFSVRELYLSGIYDKKDISLSD